jgi:hypothetical protein
MLADFYFFICEKVDSLEYLLVYFDKIFGMILVLVAIYNFIFQEDFKYDVHKNYMWIFGNLKRLFSGKLSIQIALVTLNYLVIAIPTVLFLSFSKREMIGLDVIIIIMFSYYFILLRTLMAINIFTNLWHNDYVTFVLGWLTVNVFGLLTGVIEEVLKVGDVVSSHTIQGQMVSLVPNILNNGVSSMDIVINIFLVLVAIIICEYIYILITSCLLSIH